jgi:NADPH:quinone reductase-like Zn-dependent oxidoreductase
MRAAIVRAMGQPPVFGEFPEPAAEAGETIVSVRASAVNPLTLTRAAGTHYTANSTLPAVAGVDGVGTTPDGRRVYFQNPRPPFGALAERAPAREERLLPLPAGLDDVTAAAAAIPAMSSWAPLTIRAPIAPGEAVLVHGATGAAGRLAIQIAKHLGAGRVVATGRDEQALATLAEIGADAVVSLRSPPEVLRKALREAVAAASIGVVLDYLWGPTAETLLGAFSGPGAPRGAARVRYVQIGSIAGDPIALPSAVLRSSGVELLGSGFGSLTDTQALGAIRAFFDAFPRAKFRVGTDAHPLSEVERTWGRTGGATRIVFTTG